MKAKDARIVFMGTPALAAHVLHDVVDSGYHVTAVVTAPDKPAGRGRKLNSSPVKEFALQRGIPVLQPENLKDPGFISGLRSFQPHIQVVVAFRMLPESVWSVATLGTFNLHASLLPQYRGAAPINRAIINGETKTGVTTFLIDHQIDTGNILFREAIEIEPFETAGSLHDKVQTKGGPLVKKTIDALVEGNMQPFGQHTFYSESDTLKKAPKIYREDCRIPWEKGCMAAVNHIHGLSPWPGAFTTVKTAAGKQADLKIFEARPILKQHAHVAGELLTDNRSYIHIACPDGYVNLISLQLPGKKRMTPEELLRGFRFQSPEL